MARRRGGGNYSVQFYREECPTHGKNISGCNDCKLVEKEYEVSASVSAYVPARTNCRVDDSYPAEGGEVEDIAITLNGEDVDLDDFSPKEQDKMAEMLSEAAANDDYDPREDYEPDDFDDIRDATDDIRDRDY
jgi:hypothetical protein